MGRKKDFYMVVDTETATLPFVEDLVSSTEEKKKIAIAKPLVYDLGYVICDRNGESYKKKNFLIQETFFVPSIFNTAYYKEKRPIYIEALREGTIERRDWNSAIEEMLEDLKMCKMVTAYNACFDFKKAIPFTEKYIHALYYEDYAAWEKEQKRSCKNLLKKDTKKDKSKNETYLDEWFYIRGQRFLMSDLWSLACKKLIPHMSYKDYCLATKQLTNSGIYFKTSAETVFQYLTTKYDFKEDHTALSDAEIESQILAKIAKKGKIDSGVTAFPFRELKRTLDYPKVYTNNEFKQVVVTALEDYIYQNKGCDKADSGNKYWKGVVNTYYKLVFGEEEE